MAIVVLSLNTSGEEVTGEVPAPPEGMVFIPAGSCMVGIAETDLALLEEMGKKVPHMSEVHARWWFGDEIPRHEVVLMPFFMDRYEVTNSQYIAFVEATDYTSEGEWRKYATENRKDHPVVNVTWNDARAYAEWADKRLPTEEEWECAARGGRAVNWFPWGDEPDPTLANYRAQGESFFAGLWRLLGLRKIGTKPVGQYPPNGYGLFDMVGNVCEWCADKHTPYPGTIPEDWPYKQFGPWGEDKPIVYGQNVRGGGWETPNAVFIRISGRSGYEPTYYSYNLGFRCVRSVNEQETAVSSPSN